VKVGLTLGACLFALVALLPARVISQTYSSGQPVWPAFEGWEKNDDGSFTFLFGYMNENWQEELDVPIALLGGAGGLKGNRHLATPMGTPLSNLMVTVVRGAGVPIESFGDSTGVVDLNAVAPSTA